MAIVPISSFSLIIGAIRNVRAPVRSTKATIKGLPSRYGGIDRRSSMCTTSLVLSTSAWPLPGGGRNVRNVSTPPCLGVCRRNIVERNLAEAVSVIEIQQAELRVAQPRGVRQHSLEYRFKLAGRARDDTEDLRGRGLLLQRFPQLVEQARVLDGDDGLRGEILHQLDLFISERPDFAAIDTKDTDQLILFEQRHSKDGARACVPGKRGVRVLHRQVHELLGAHELIEGGGNARRYVRFPFVEFGKLWRRIVQGDASEPVTFAQCHGAETGLANARGILQRFLEHRPQFAGRRADDAQYIRGGGLLLERLAQLVEQARVLDRDDGLGGEARN